MLRVIRMGYLGSFCFHKSGVLSFLWTGFVPNLRRFEFCLRAVQDWKLHQCVRTFLLENWTNNMSVVHSEQPCGKILWQLQYSGCDRLEARLFFKLVSCCTWQQLSQMIHCDRKPFYNNYVCTYVTTRLNMRSVWELISN